MRCLVLAAVLATPLALSVRAQPVPAAPFSAPLGIGNRWEYVLTNAAVTPPAVTGYLVATVDGEVTVNGEPYRVLTRQQFAADRTPATARTTCAYNPARGTAPAGSTSLPDYSCVARSGFRRRCRGRPARRRSRLRRRSRSGRRASPSTRS